MVPADGLVQGEEDVAVWKEGGEGAKQVERLQDQRVPHGIYSKQGVLHYIDTTCGFNTA